MTTQPVPVSVIIPAYNEAAGITNTLHELLTHPEARQYEIIVVNDASTDETAQIVSQITDVKLITHRVNQGYSGAVTTGMRRANGKYVIWYDADGQHQPDDLVRIAQHMHDENLDYCIGVRGMHADAVKSRRMGKKILRWVVQRAASGPVHDFNSGLRGFRRDLILQYMHLMPKGFGASTMTTLLMMERNHRGMDIPITVRERVGESTVKPFRDGFRTLMIILRIVLLFKPLLFFGMIGALLIVSGTVYGLYETVSEGTGFPVFGALVIILGIQSLFFGLLNDQISLLRRERFERFE